MSIVVRHTFVDPDTPDEKTLTSDKTAVIAVGSTAAGKSSIIRLYCGDQVVVGHNAHSETQGSTLHRELGSQSKYWLDSQGSNDSNGADDEEVLCDILQALYNEQIALVKIVWCVSGDLLRASQELQTQARFIASLGERAWDSCLIVKKKGEPHPQDIVGVLAAARQYRSRIISTDAAHLLGFTALAAIDRSSDPTIRFIHRYVSDHETRQSEYKEAGYLTDEQIVSAISDKLSPLASVAIVFAILRCSKCGVRGDPRFVYAPCHAIMQLWHPRQPDPYHPGSVRHRHASQLIPYHSGSAVTHHNYESYHPRNWDCHQVRNVSMHVLSFGIHTIARAATDSFGDWPCCGSHKRNKAGCQQRIVNAYVKWSCCGRSGNAAGCLKKYSCCNGAVGGNGCLAEWSCCSAAQSNPGCRRRHTCCQSDEGTDGCQRRCQTCQREWGNSTGCTHSTR